MAFSKDRTAVCQILHLAGRVSAGIVSLADGLSSEVDGSFKLTGQVVSGGVQTNSLIDAKAFQHASFALQVVMRMWSTTMPISSRLPAQGGSGLQAVWKQNLIA